METAILVFLGVIVLGILGVQVDQHIIRAVRDAPVKAGTTASPQTAPLQVIHTTLVRRLNPEQTLLIDEDRQQWAILTTGNLRPAKVYRYLDLLNVTLEDSQAELQTAGEEHTPEEVQDQLIHQQRMYPLLVTVTLRNEPLKDSALLLNIMTFGSDEADAPGEDTVDTAPARKALAVDTPYAVRRSLRAREIFTLFQLMKNSARG